ncbi:MAG: YkgJ family cysteine cluster protein [Myxococcota bacterium]
MIERSALRVLHDEVSSDAAETRAALPFELNCRKGCSACCVDGLTVFEVEADNIRQWVGTRLEGQAPHPVGACAFLDSEGGCGIYPVRPYVCRTQGLPLVWADESGLHLDICPLNDPGDETLLGLDESQCWTLGRVEGRLAALQGDGRRVPLRSLFAEVST